MRLFGWFRGKSVNGGRPELEAWRRRWLVAAKAPAASAVAALTAELDALALPDDEIEIEREMLDGLEQVARLQETLAAAGLPTVETGHRVVGTEPCHFSAPSSMPDDAAQPTGRLIFTGARAIFAGGGRALTLPWHGVADIVQQERDLILIRHGGDTFHRFRCNVYADALCAGLLARTLSRRGKAAR